MSDKQFIIFTWLCLRVLWIPRIDGVLDFLHRLWLSIYTVALFSVKHFML